MTVLYDNGLAQYDVQESKNGHFIARLYRYNGKGPDSPPQEIEIYKEGRHWKDDGAEQALVDDIGLAIEYDKRVPDQPVLNQRGAENTRDSGREGSRGRP